MPKPNTADYPEYFGQYISKVPEEDLATAFNNQAQTFPSLLHSINEEKSNHAYAEDKWTIKELLQHLIDTERIFNYRALAIARKETVSLPSFDENLYATNSNANGRSWSSLVNEFLNLRASTQDLYNSFNEQMLSQKGLANNKLISVLSLGFTTIGHIYHHKNVLEERYL
jgi:DinB superfamily